MRQQTPEKGKKDVTRFLLIHGSFFGGWCWDRVAENLRRQGHSVFTPTLTPFADSPIDLSCHIADVIEALDQVGGTDTILVGHSYGGMPVLGAADARARAIGALVLLDAFAPRDDESVLSIRAAAQSSSPALTKDGAAIAVPDPTVLGLGKWTDHLASQLTPQPHATWTERIQLTGAFAQIQRKYFARMTGFKAPYLDQTYDRLKLQADWQVTRCDEGHCPMLTAPEWTSAFLNRIAQQTSNDLL